MILFWKIRYLERADKQFKDRNLLLNTDRLDALTRAAVEFVLEQNASNTDRSILNYRHLFVEKDDEAIVQELELGSQSRGIVLTDYFEDETGAEITLREMGPILTDDPQSVLIPSGARKYDLDFMFAEPKPIPVAEVSLDDNEIRLLGYFVRDYQEMRDSAFMKDGPGSLKGTGTFSGTPLSNPTLETAVSDDEIRSFVTIFRRLYMEREPANFKQAVGVYVKALGDHPLARWVAGIAAEYQRHLDSVPEVRPFVQAGTCTFNTKRLIDVFLYTQYVHQPDKKRQGQFTKCLDQVRGQKAVLTWMFLTELWKCSLEISNAGKQIATWFRRYCEQHRKSPNVLASLCSELSGFGVKEKGEERKARLFREKSDEVAMELWKQNGHPEGGPAQFLPMAREQLSQVLHGGKRSP